MKKLFVCILLILALPYISLAAILVPNTNVHHDSCRLSSGLVVVAYGDYINLRSGYPSVVAGTGSGASISWGTPLVLDAVNPCAQIRITAFNTDLPNPTACVTYSWYGVGFNEIWVQMISVDPATLNITAGVAQYVGWSISNVHGYYKDVVRISNTKGAVVFGNSYGCAPGYAVETALRGCGFDVDANPGRTISNIPQLNGDACPTLIHNIFPFCIRVAVLDAASSKIVMSYRDNALTTDQYVTACTVQANNTLTVGAPVEVQNDAVNKYLTDIVSTEVDKFAVYYEDADVSPHNTYTKIGTAAGLVITIQPTSVLVLSGEAPCAVEMYEDLLVHSTDESIGSVSVGAASVSDLNRGYLNPGVANGHLTVCAFDSSRPNNFTFLYFYTNQFPDNNLHYGLLLYSWQPTIH